MFCAVKMSNMSRIFPHITFKYIFLASLSVSKRVLFSVWLMENDASNKFVAVQTYVYNNIIDRNMYNDSDCAKITEKIKNFTKKLASKWQENHRIRKNFEVRNKEWLDDELILVDLRSNAGRRSRPELTFTESQEKTKKKKFRTSLKQFRAKSSYLRPVLVCIILASEVQLR